MGMASSAACECGADEQTVDHVVPRREVTRLDGPGARSKFDGPMFEPEVFP